MKWRIIRIKWKSSFHFEFIVRPGKSDETTTKGSSHAHKPKHTHTQTITQQQNWTFTRKKKIKKTQRKIFGQDISCSLVNLQSEQAKKN